MDDEQGDVTSGLIDLTGVDLGRLTELDSAVLEETVEAIRDEVEHPESAVAGFQSSF